MNSHNSRDKLGLLAHAVILGYLLNISLPAIAQTQTGQDEELLPIVLEDRSEFDDEPVVDELDDEFDSEAGIENASAGSSSESYDEQIARLFGAYREAMFASAFSEADTLAKQIVELSIRVNGLDSRKSATALTNLAVAQQGMGEYPSAVLNYEAAIGIIERIEDRLSARLINPLRGLGAAHMALGRPDMAKKAYDRAVHVSHVSDGPHNPDQIETLMSLAETYLAVGETKSAANVQKRIFYLQARNIDANSIDMIPALQTRASWQRRMSFFEQERYTLRRIIRVVEKNKGKDSLELISPLTNLANSYLTDVIVGLPAQAQPSVSTGEPYLKRAIRITEKNSAATWQDRVGAKLQLGDYYILTDRAGRAHSVYRDAWDILSEDESLLDIRASTLEEGTILRDVYIPNKFDDSPAAPTANEPAGYLEGTTLFGYSVNTRGRATDIKLLDADPRGLDKVYTKIGRELRYIVHRPRMVDGVPIPLDQKTFSHNFFYREEDLPKIPDSSQSTTKKAASN